MSAWKPMSSFPYPAKECDHEYRQFLFYSKESGQQIGSCIMQPKWEDCEPNEYRFGYSSEDWEMIPTHWQELQEDPREEENVVI